MDTLVGALEFPCTLEPGAMACTAYDYVVKCGDPNPLVNTVCVRAETCDCLTEVTASACSCVTICQDPTAAIFSDVPTDNWAWTGIESCVAHDIVAGFPDGA